MLLREFLEKHNLGLTVTYNTEHFWARQYTVGFSPSADIRDGPAHIGAWGHGKTPRAAIGDYVQQIQGKVLEANRILIEVPEDLSLGKLFLVCWSGHSPGPMERIL